MSDVVFIHISSTTAPVNRDAGSRASAQCRRRTFTSGQPDARQPTWYRPRSRHWSSRRPAGATRTTDASRAHGRIPGTCKGLRRVLRRSVTPRCGPKHWSEAVSARLRGARANLGPGHVACRLQRPIHEQPAHCTRLHSAATLAFFSGIAVVKSDKSFLVPAQCAVSCATTSHHAMRALTSNTTT